ncbi:MAG: flavodoxin domain-containing protein [Actinomycetota bacterium]|nr:flavodoxin domain-containing protein [Actinomycetota bacterium]
MKILIAYGSSYGTTEKCAGILADILKKKNYEADPANLKKNQRINLKGYDLIAIGGSFIAFRMNSAVRKFVKRNLNTLLNKKTALFMCGAGEDREKEIKKGFPGKLLKKAVTTGYFGYEILWDKLNPFFRSIMQKAFKTTETVSKINHENIEKFAEDIIKAISS